MELLVCSSLCWILFFERPSHSIGEGMFVWPAQLQYEVFQEEKHCKSRRLSLQKRLRASDCLKVTLNYKVLGE